MKIDFTNWKTFRFGDLIDNIYKAKAYVKEELKYLQPYEKNSIPFVSRTEINNSVDCFVDVSGLTNIEKGNAIVIGDTTATISYQKNDFVTGDHIVVIRASWINEFTGLFVSAILKQEKFRYSYGRAYIMDSISNTQIKLPAKDDGTPDWKYMGNYIKSLHHKRLKTQNKKSLMKLDFTNWKYYKFSDIFEIKKGFYNKKPDHESNGTIPFLGATDSDNGVTEYYSLSDIEQGTKTGDDKNSPITEKIFPGNALCVTNNGSVGYAYYQEKEFTCSHDVNPLYLKNGKWSIYTALFVATVIMRDRYRWAYGRKWRPERMKKSKLKLPSKQDGTPDWEYMENYIKSLPYADCL